MSDVKKENILKTSKSAKKEETWGDVFKQIFWIVAVLMIFRTFVYQTFNIPSESMMKTLHHGDYIIVSKFSYGYSHHSFPWSVKLFSGRVFDKPVERGDVIVFRKPSTPDVYYIKRVIGLPEDIIQLKRGIIHINNIPIGRKKIENFSRMEPEMTFEANGAGLYKEVPTGKNFKETFVQYEETLPNGKTYITLDKEDIHQDETKAFYVPKGKYFVMGDNRDNSLDSRFTEMAGGVGTVPAVNVVGKAKWVAFSFNKDAKLYEFWNWFPKRNSERAFTAIK